MPTEITCFIIMPFLPELEPVLKVFRQVVLKHGNGIGFRADDAFEPGAIIEQVKDCIGRSDFCIADVSGANPNVLWEAGYAHALGKPIIQVSQETSVLPFDIRALRTEKYSLDALKRSVETGEPTEFHDRLERAVQTVVSTLRQKPRVLGPPHDELKNLAEQLDRQSVYKSRREPLLGIVLKALAWEKSHGSNYLWKTTDAQRFANALIKSCGSASQDAFWWLIALGVFAYDQIDQFQRNGSNGIRENLPLVQLSDRGVHLLNQLREPIP